MPKRTQAEIRGFLQTQAARMRLWPEPAERALLPWMTMAGFEHQYVFEYARVILDFYNPTYKLCVEIDGGYHKKRKGPDERRARRLKTMLGIETLRFANKDVLEHTEAAAQTIREKAARMLLEQGEIIDG